MKLKAIILTLLTFLTFQLDAQRVGGNNFQAAFDEIHAMLEGERQLDLERAVFLTENAYRDNVIAWEDFKATLDVSTEMIQQLITVNDTQDWKRYVKGTKVTPQRELQAKERYQTALANWAIFKWMTDTVELRLNGQQLFHLPLTYSNDDPFGTADWKNSQVLNLFESGKGNCYALVTLFKLFSERFKSGADIVTAPQHIYIEHPDPNGNLFNVELATRSFPNMGSIQTLTYTTREGLLNDISMRSLDLRQSVGLCLIYLAKGYQYKYKTNDDEFLLTCANTALQYDSKNLNALLLKAQVYEQRVMQKQMETAPYESLLADLYKLGYRQMPDDMREVILSRIQGRPSSAMLADKNPNPHQNIGEQSRSVTLSNGLFEEVHQSQRVVRYGRTIFDTEESRIIKFLDEDISTYQVDPVVFALSVDPLTKSYPELTPYQFASNRPIEAIDLDGLEAHDLFMELEPVRSLREEERKKGIVHADTPGDKVSKAALGTLGVLAVAPALTLVSSEGIIVSLFFRGAGTIMSNPTIATSTGAIAAWIQNPKNQQLIAEGGAFVAGIIDPNPNAQYSAGPGDELGNFVGGVFRTSARGVDYFFRNARSGEEVAIGTADLMNGSLRLNFDIPENLREGGIGSQMFQDALQFYGNKVKSVFGAWTDGDNLKAFNDALKSGLSESDAVFGTPTGKWAKSNGFTNYEITFKEGETTNDYLGVGVSFTKPND